MREPYAEGPASHTGPEPCLRDGNVPCEALTGEDAGQPLSSEITPSACRPRPDRKERCLAPLGGLRPYGP